jgi:RNA polymerase sigma factor (sigma-70 family)
MTDQEIIEAIRKGERERAIAFLYKEFPKIRQLVLKSGCNDVVAREVFNDSLLLLIEKVQKPEFELTSKLTTYLYGINRFMVKNELRRQNKTAYELEWSDTLILSESDLGYDTEKEEQLNRLDRILDQLSDKCRQIFELFYFRKESMETIAQTMNYSSVSSAKTQKYKCMEHALELAKKYPDSQYIGDRGQSQKSLS